MLRLWLEWRGDRPGALFHRLDRAAGADGAQPAKPLSGGAITAVLRAAAQRLRLEGRFPEEGRVSSHSLRRGLATTLDAKGLDLAGIQAILRHENTRTTAGYLGGQIAERRAPQVF